MLTLNQLIALGKPTGTAAADLLRVRAWEVKEDIDLDNASRELNDQRQQIDDEGDAEDEDNVEEAPEQELDEELPGSPSWDLLDPEPLPPPFKVLSSAKVTPIASSSKASTSKAPGSKAPLPKASTSKPKALSKLRPAIAKAVERSGASSDIEVLGPGPAKPNPKKRKAEANEIDVQRVRKTTAVITKSPTQRGCQSNANGTLERLEGYLNPSIDQEAAKEAAAVRREDNLAQLMLLGKNSELEVLGRTIETLRRDLSDEHDKRVQAERAVDQANAQINMMSLFTQMGGQAGNAAPFGVPFGGAPFGAGGAFGAPLFGAGAAPFAAGPGPFGAPAANAPVPQAEWQAQAHDRVEPPVRGVVHPFDRDADGNASLEDL
jgi:hypothetical protein